jgi:hypothetical protein
MDAVQSYCGSVALKKQNYLTKMHMRGRNRINCPSATHKPRPPHTAQTQKMIHKRPPSVLRGFAQVCCATSMRNITLV